MVHNIKCTLKLHLDWVVLEVNMINSCSISVFLLCLSFFGQQYPYIIDPAHVIPFVFYNFASHLASMGLVIKRCKCLIWALLGLLLRFAFLANFYCFHVNDIKIMGVLFGSNFFSSSFLQDVLGKDVHHVVAFLRCFQHVKSWWFNPYTMLIVEEMIKKILTHYKKLFQFSHQQFKIIIKKRVQIILISEQHNECNNYEQYWSLISVTNHLQT